MKAAKVTHGDCEFYCEMSTHKDAVRELKMWVIDVCKIDTTNMNSDASKGFVCADASESECLKWVPRVIATLVKEGLPADMACDLVGEAIGTSQSPVKDCVPA